MKNCFKDWSQSNKGLTDQSDMLVPCAAHMPSLSSIPSEGPIWSTAFLLAPLKVKEHRLKTINRLELKSIRLEAI